MYSPAINTLLSRMRGGRPSLKAQVGTEMDRYNARGAQVEGGADAQRAEATSAYRDFDPDQFLGSDALRALFDDAGTGWRGELSGLRGANERRGIRGPLSGALEGDLASGFERRLLGTTAQFAGQRAGLALQRAGGLADRADRETEYGAYNRGQALELLMGERDRQTASQNAKRQADAQKWGAVGGLAGTAAGFFF